MKETRNRSVDIRQTIINNNSLFSRIIRRKTKHTLRCHSQLLLLRMRDFRIVFSHGDPWYTRCLK